MVFLGIIMNGLFPEVLETTKCLTKSELLSQHFLVVNLPKDLNQWRLKGQLPDETKYVIYNHNLSALIKAPFGVFTAFPNGPYPTFSSHCNSQESKASSCNISSCSETKVKSYTTKTVSTTIQTEPESFIFQSDTQLTKSV